MTDQEPSQPTTEQTTTPATGAGGPDRAGPAGRRRQTGLVFVFTGDGKGKTTAALGLALRAVGHGFRVRVIQFVKGTWWTGELAAARRLAPELEIVPAGRGFTLPALQRPREREVPRQDHQAAAAAALELARQALASGDYRVVVLDEVLYALRDRLVALEDVLGLIATRPAGVHLVLTGRAAPPEVVAAADVVTEMREVKHPHAAGVVAQRGIEF